MVILGEKKKSVLTKIVNTVSMLEKNDFTPLMPKAVLRLWKENAGRL